LGGSEDLGLCPMGDRQSISRTRKTPAGNKKRSETRGGKKNRQHKDSTRRIGHSNLKKRATAKSWGHQKRGQERTKVVPAAPEQGTIGKWGQEEDTKGKSR